MSDFDIEIQEGRIYPGWQKPFEASMLNIVSEGLHLLVSIPFPRPVDLEDFKNLTGYSIFEDDYPLVKISCFPRHATLILSGRKIRRKLRFFFQACTRIFPAP